MRLRRWLLLAAGIVVAVAMYGGAGYAAWLNARLSDAIVSEPWRNPVEIVSATGGEEPILKLYGSDWRVTDPLAIEELPPHVARAFVAAEDVRFYRHFGIDPWGLMRAAFTNLRHGGVREGGSTITQQLIKQKLFSNDRTFRRKVPEMLMAIVLTMRMSKDEILEGYLNEVYLGQFGGAPVYGIDEASRVFFDKPASKLRADEAALIAGVVRAPNRDNPLKRPEEARARRDAILAVMREEKWLTDDEFEEARERKIRLSEGELPDTPYAHYLSALRTELARHAPDLPSSGIRIYTHLDPDMQRAAERSARSGIAALRKRARHLSRKDDLQVAILSADPKSGGIRALVGSRSFVLDQFDRTSRMRRQPGSALKPFVYAAALESKKFTPVTTLEDTPLRIKLAKDRYWSPHNYDERFRGPVALRVAMEQSLNVPTVRLSEDLGRREVASKFGEFGFPEEFERVPSLPLGVTEVTLRELVAAYSAFPSLGTVPELHLVREVRDRDGSVLYRREPKERRALDPAVAWLTHDLLRGVVARGTASRLSSTALGSFVAGKTGTTTEYRDAWFVGYAPDLVTGVWVGCDGGSPLRLSAGEAAVPLWGAYMSRIKTSEREIPPPDGVVFREIDPTSGRLWRSGCDGPVREAFLEGTEPDEPCSPRGGSLLAWLRGNPEPPEISTQTWERWSGEPTARRSTRSREDDRDEPRRGGGIARPERERDDDAERWAREAEQRFERLQREREKRLKQLEKQFEKEMKRNRGRGRGRD